MSDLTMEMNFCRRCGEQLEHKNGVLFECRNGHKIFYNSIPAMTLILVNDNNELLVLERAEDPGKGMLDAPGGFCDGTESVEEAIAREVREEVGLDPSDYTEPEFMFTATNPYDFGGETVTTLGVQFVARMKTGKQPVAGDDAATVRWVSAAELDLDKVFFPVVRKAYEQVIARL